MQTQPRQCAAISNDHPSTRCSSRVSKNTSEIRLRTKAQSSLEASCAGRTAISANLLAFVGDIVQGILR